MGEPVLKRRGFLQAAGLSVVSSLAGMSVPARAQMEQPMPANRDRVTWRAPLGACDCHMHIFEKRFPATPNAPIRPPDATVDDYLVLRRALGLTRTVVVTPSTYGTDNSCTMYAMAALGSSARGVAVVDTSVTDRELKRLHAAGIRGIRFNMVNAGATTMDMIEPLSLRIHELGWHAQIQMTANQIVDNQAMLARLMAPVVFDHLARLPQPAGITHPAFTIVSRLIERGRTWIKLSGAYLDSKVGAPTYADAASVIQTYLRLAPERMVWGSNWPHPSTKNKPDDVTLFNAFADWIPDEAQRDDVFVKNAAALYDFL